MSKRRVLLLLNDILDAIRRIDKYVEGLTVNDFLADEKTSDAVVRNLEIIGEAANRIPDEEKEKLHSIEWHKVIGLRNRIVHEYFGIDLLLIWQIIQKDIPIIKKRISDIQGD